jgi:hypothetical protein
MCWHRRHIRLRVGHQALSSALTRPPLQTFWLCSSIPFLCKLFDGSPKHFFRPFSCISATPKLCAHNMAVVTHSAPICCMPQFLSNVHLHLAWRVHRNSLYKSSFTPRLLQLSPKVLSCISCPLVLDCVLDRLNNQAVSLVFLGPLQLCKALTVGGYNSRRNCPTEHLFHDQRLDCLTTSESLVPVMLLPNRLCNLIYLSFAHSDCSSNINSCNSRKG